jgi:energy-coupling factor transporter ATP-binding protein EcfA2
MELPSNATIVLVPRKVALTLKGTTHDAMTPAQIVRWGLERSGYSKTQQKPLRDAIEGAGKLQTSDVDSERLQRFRELCERAMKGIDLGIEVAQALGDSAAFKPLLEGHREQLLESEVKRLVGERKRQIEEQITNQEKELARKKGDVDALQVNYDKAKAAQERQLTEEHGGWLKNIQEREDQVARAEKELADKQAKFGRALEGAITDYRDRSQSVLQEVLTLMPLLSGMNPASIQTTATVSPSLLPAWLDEPKARAGSIDKEKDFLHQFAEVARRRGFHYPEDVLVALHASVKSGSWTVLAGPSGLGKSTLPVLYAEALGQRQELLQVPVRPDWLDDRQVLGAFNPLVNRFESSATGITEHLIQAAEDWRRQRGGIYLFLLDEMNLARVEHYFARFLSVLERRPDERIIELFSRTQESPADPMSRHRVLAVPPNVRFIGTVNLDETVHFFSPKVLDRCSVVGLSAGPLNPALHPQAVARDLGVRPVLWSSYESWCRPPAECPGSIVQLLQTIDETLRAARLGLGYRAFQRARTFAAGARELLALDVVTDFAVFQFVLPRVRTMQRDAKRVLDHLKRLLPAERYPRSSDAVARMQDGDEFFHVIG